MNTSVRSLFGEWIRTNDKNEKSYVSEGKWEFEDLVTESG
jgi:hypothetical protein